MKIALVQLNPKVGDIEANASKIAAAIDQAQRSGCRIALFPELALTGYPPEDLLLAGGFLEAVERALAEIAAICRTIVAVVGAPSVNEGRGKPLHNSAAILQEGRISRLVHKQLLPTYDLFDERRFFEPGRETALIEVDEKRIGVTLCEDIWQHADVLEDVSYRRDPVRDLAALKPALVLNLSASPYAQYKLPLREKVMRQAALAMRCPLFLVNQVGANDSLVFDGHSSVVDQEGILRVRLKGFEEEMAIVDDSLSGPQAGVDETESLLRALALGVRDYFHKQGFGKALLGLSGGVDSAVVACVAAEALGGGNVQALSLPSRFTAGESERDAALLASRLGIELRPLSIEPGYECLKGQLQQWFNAPCSPLTDENLQARLRGLLLMGLSNQCGPLLLNTSNKSEMAMGYSTLYGDLTGALSVIGDVWKSDVYRLARHLNRKEEVIPRYVIERAPSAELREGQRDADTLPEYATLDAVLRAWVEERQSVAQIAAELSLTQEFVQGICEKVYLAEYKRRQAPPALRVSGKAFCAGRRVPIVQGWLPQ